MVNRIGLLDQTVREWRPLSHTGENWDTRLLSSSLEDGKRLHSPLQMSMQLCWPLASRLLNSFATFSVSILSMGFARQEDCRGLTFLLEAPRFLPGKVWEGEMPWISPKWSIPSRTQAERQRTSVKLVKWSHSSAPKHSRDRSAPGETLLESAFQDVWLPGIPK